MSSALQYPTVIAGAAILDADRRLFLMRSSGKFGDQWIIPGGKVNFGETAAAAVVREVRRGNGSRRQQSFASGRSGIYRAGAPFFLHGIPDFQQPERRCHFK
jgi:hypothetical protein